jgi:thiamine biosynthesis lipoprotein
MDRIEALMSTYREDSEISAVNRGAAAGPVAVSPELGRLVRRALELSVATGGAFDITYESVGRYYDFRARERPDAATVAANLPAIDYRHVVVAADDRSIRFTHPGTRINLGGIAKGWACEQVAADLRAAGIRHGFVTAGGDTRFIGDRRGQPWVVGIRDPDRDGATVTRLALDDQAVSTSGDYERYFDEGGVRHHHILDPRTGESARGLRSVTVVGPDATVTEALAKGVFVRGPVDGIAMVEAVAGYDAVLIDPGHGVRFTAGLAPR